MTCCGSLFKLLFFGILKIFMVFLAQINYNLKLCNKVSSPLLICRVLAQDHTSIFTWKNKCKFELEDHAKLSASWPSWQSGGKHFLWLLEAFIHFVQLIQYAWLIPFTNH